MTFKIEQNTMCDYCESNFETSRDRCEGSKCGEAYEAYLEDYGILVDEKEVLTFLDFNLQDKLYILDTKAIPSIKTARAYAITQRQGEHLRIRYDSEVVVVDQDHESKGRVGNVYLSMKDCKARLDEICLERIVELSKTMG